MSFNINLLNNSKAVWFRGFTFPAFQHLLFRPELDSPTSMVVAMGAEQDGKPAGLALVTLHEDGKQAEFLSIFVDKSYRKQGLAIQMISHVEKELQNRHCDRVRLEYERGRPLALIVEGLINKCGYPEPTPYALIGRCNDIRTTDIRWAKKSILPSAYEIFPWSELTQEERESILSRQQQSPWYPDVLSPFKDERIMEPATSIGLRTNGEVIGWHITHRISKDTLRYTATFVRDDLQRYGLGIALIAEAIRRHIAHKDPELKKVTFITLLIMDRAAVFFKRRMRPHLDELNESMQSIKILNEC